MSRLRHSHRRSIKSGKHLIVFFSVNLSSADLIMLPTTKNSMRLCNLCAIGNIIFCRKNLSFLRTTRPFDVVIHRRSSMLGMIDGLNFCKTTYTIKHMSRVENKVVDALNRRVFLLIQLSAEVLGFERIKEEY